MRSSTKGYFVFFGITFLGSCLTAIAAFLQVDQVFHSMTYVGVTLSSKTLFLTFVGILAPRIILRFGLRRSLLVSQLAGFFCLGLLYAGFTTRSFPLVLVAVFCSGIPTTFLSIIGTSLYRFLSSEPDEFRKLQGTQATIGGLCFLAATILAPFLLASKGIAVVLMIDASTYLIGAFFLSSAFSGWIEQIDQTKDNNAETSRQALEKLGLARDRRVLAFGATGTAAFLLVGIAPLISTSRESYWASMLQGHTHGAFWSIEALSSLLSGWMYRAYVRNEWFKKLIANPIPVGVLLIPLVYAHTAPTIAISLGAVLLAMGLRFMKVRDDFLLKFDSQRDTVRANAWVSMMSNFIMFASPLILVPLIRTQSTPVKLVVFTVSVQGLLAYAGQRLDGSLAGEARSSLEKTSAECEPAGP